MKCLGDFPFEGLLVLQDVALNLLAWLHGVGLTVMTVRVEGCPRPHVPK